MAALALRYGHVIQPGSGHIQDLALLTNAQFGVRFFYQLGTCYRPSCLDFF